MLRDRDSGSTAFRVGLWQRGDALGPQVRGSVQSRTSLSASDLEDLWSELLATSVHAVGDTGALPADAEGWSDARLAAWFRDALWHDAIDEYRRRVNSAGETWVAGTPLDELTGELEGGSIWRSVRPATPEEALLARTGLQERTADLQEVLGHDAARMKLAEAAGASGPEQRELLQLTVGRWRSLQDQVAMSAATLRGRAQAALVWLWPDAFVRWVLGLVGGAAGGALTTGGVTKVVAGTLAAIGTIGVAGHEATKPKVPTAKISPVLTTRPAAGSAATRTSSPTVSLASATTQATQQAASSVRTAAATERRRAAAARRRERLAREARQRREREAAARRRREATQTPEAAPEAPTQTATSAPTGTASSSTGSTGTAAATEFSPSGR